MSDGILRDARNSAILQEDKSSFKFAPSSLESDRNESNINVSSVETLNQVGALNTNIDTQMKGKSRKEVAQLLKAL
jgi:hypothetical protein